MAPNISVGRGVFASAFFAVCLGLVVTQTFAQTVTQQAVKTTRLGHLWSTFHPLEASD
jgi:hypothetical protein